MKIIGFSLILFFRCLGAHGQRTFDFNDLKYIGTSNSATLNSSFVNKRMVFLNGKGSVIMNIKIAFDIKERKIYDPGIFYNCKLDSNSKYSFKLWKIRPADIPKEYNTYYRTNCIFKTKNGSRFKEFKKDTKYYFVGNTGMYVDINHELFEIKKMTPANGCTMQL